MNNVMTQEVRLLSDFRPAVDQTVRKKVEISREDHPYGLHTVDTDGNSVDLEHSASDAQQLC